ncbi:MAG: type I restriction endonuclease subunit R [Cytophagales bacterium]|jgi:type I restriction enzyme R subunit|nr:type I restriction endonuclease subunit R [Cytophagales bacterium]MCA6389189.1 type I restriction endonuclease subunit R [Cytophagales bacterium]MCA6390338.1 type I restriction endonuclease subunit R [Cytophagales bacterium]MCA6396465.1 type I restriction endonuclease subunit R [Cytophagales bacterium]MCA6402243.1 type I restriction endonuclease subunit R [Cytophagales bacterium]
MAYLNESHVEVADINFFVDKLGYTHINAWEKQLVGRSSLKEVVLKDRLRNNLKSLNKHLPISCIEHAVSEITKSRATLTPIIANKEVYELIKKGVPVSYKNDQGREENDYVQIIDFSLANRNEFLIVSQLSIEYLQTQNITRRPDLLLYVNGLPLIMIELKNATEKVKVGYDKNLKDYQRDIPQLFWFNLFVCISNGIQTRVGSFNSPWDHFFSWLKLKDTAITHDQPTKEEIEKESERTGEHLSLKIFGEGLCKQENLIDYFENFVLYHKNKVKIIAKNHQFLGVNNAIVALQNKDTNKGKLGVFWHTQGSGKSYSMIFFSKKIQRKVNGNWSFLIITDRKDLDGQIYRNFVETETVVETKEQKENYFRPSDQDKLKDYLQSNRAFVFTLIYKFGIESGKTFPQLTDRKDWIVIVDEAHRTQYKTLAENMRLGLPHAQYIAFTGTPLLRSELTKDKFGDYVSEYNFAQSIEDGATVPLYYKKSVPQVEQVNSDLVGDAAAILEEENLSEEQKKKLDKEYSTLLNVVRRDDRLEEIAMHIVKHFPYRLDVLDDNKIRRPMKAMVISIDKFTAVKMYDKVQYHLKEEVKELRKKIVAEQNPELKKRYERAITFINETKMAVVISQEGGDKEEEKAFAEVGLDIKPHRYLIDHPDEDGRNIEDYFKDPNNTYRIVFVTAMWMTGFDAPSVSTLYLDKPLQNHTLMQTIARANRVIEGKKNGLVIDYFGVFRNLKIALAAYAEGTKGKTNKKDDDSDEYPAKEFEELLALLEQATTEAKAYCKELGADIDRILSLSEKGFKDIEMFQEYANIILAKDEYRKQLGLFVNTIVSLYDSATPEVYDYPLIKKNRDVLQYLRDVVDRNVDQDEAVARAKKKIDALLDTSVLSKGDLTGEAKVEYTINDSRQIDLSKLNFAVLRAQFPEKKHKNIQFADLRELLEIKLNQMIAQNKTRGSFLVNFQKVIDDYNSGSLSIDEAYEELIKQAEVMSEEEQRAAKNEMTEAEQELFDLLKKEKLTKAEEKEVRLAAKTLLSKLFDAKNKILIQEWHKEKATQEIVKREIQKVLSEYLPEESYDRMLFSQKVDVAFQHFYDLAELGPGVAA